MTEPSNYNASTGAIHIPKVSTASYPLARCPQCHHAFREEITGTARSGSELALVKCPHCGVQFQRFSLSPATA